MNNPRLRYTITRISTGEQLPADDTIVTQDGHVAFWDEGQGWCEVDDDSDYRVQVLEVPNPNPDTFTVSREFMTHIRDLLQYIIYSTPAEPDEILAQAWICYRSVSRAVKTLPYDLKDCKLRLELLDWK